MGPVIVDSELALGGMRKGKTEGGIKFPLELKENLVVGFCGAWQIMCKLSVPMVGGTLGPRGKFHKCGAKPSQAKTIN